ncbi:hypothetical protein VTG60DRAFT_6034 [Thermothelomyces hinnuleus]
MIERLLLMLACSFHNNNLVCLFVSHRSKSHTFITLSTTHTNYTTGFMVAFGRSGAPSVSYARKDLVTLHLRRRCPVTMTVSFASWSFGRSVAWLEAYLANLILAAVAAPFLLLLLLVLLLLVLLVLLLLVLLVLLLLVLLLLVVPMEHERDVHSNTCSPLHIR